MLRLGRKKWRVTAACHLLLGVVIGSRRCLLVALSFLIWKVLLAHKTVLVADGLVDVWLLVTAACCSCTYPTSCSHCRHRPVTS